MPEIDNRGGIRIRVDVVDSHGEVVRDGGAVHRTFLIPGGIVAGTQVGRMVAQMVREIEGLRALSDWPTAPRGGKGGA